MMRIALVLLVFVLLFGCIGEWRTLAKPHEDATGGTAAPPGPPDSIGYLYVYHQYGTYGAEDWYDVSFTLEDENGNVVTAPGTVLVTITDEKGNTLYTKQSTVSESDFEASEGYPFYGNMVYTQRAYFDEIGKSSSDYANFTIEYTIGNKVLKKTKKTYLAYDLIDYSDSSYTYDYRSHLKTINMTSTKNGLQITLVEGGYDYYNDYDMELEFKNTGTKKKKITITDVALIVGGTQYEPSLYYYDDYELGNVYPGATLSKSMTFYNVKETAENATLYLELEIQESDAANQTIDVQFSFQP